MAFVDIHPQFRELLARQGLVTAGDFLALQGVVYSGHPDRHVVRVAFGGEAEAIPAVLKREHRTRWRDRLANAWAGFGFVSKSYREFVLLRALEQTGIGSPRAMAAGEDDNGRAFLLVRELESYQDLRQFLGEMRSMPPDKRRGIARRLGTVLARLHNAGYDHPDLYSKHILVSPAPPPECLSFRVVDWQRSQKRERVGWTKRWRDLSALDATLAGELATGRERLQALYAYLRACRTAEERRCGLTLAAAAHEVRRRANRLLERRRIREMRQPPLAPGTQNLIWLDGEALLVTREFRDELGGQAAAWLGSLLQKGSETSSADAGAPGQTRKDSRPLFREQAVALPGARFAHLVTRWASRPWRWLWARLRRRTLVAPELESMKVLFRLQRYGVVLPRLLAAGQKHLKPWQTQSFLLTEPQSGAVPLPTFLAEAGPAARRAVLRQAAGVLRQMHQASCYLEHDKRDFIGDLLTVCAAGTVALATVHGIEKSHYPNPMRGQHDLAALVRCLEGACSRTDLLRGLLHYLGLVHLTPAAKRFTGRVLRRLEGGRRARRVA
jgi:tRNA A-37 threonylcarbamoyl transferase component Bud32